MPAVSPGISASAAHRPRPADADRPPVRDRASPLRFPITAITVVGLGALVALAVGVSLYLGLSSATENTRRLMAQRSEALVDGLEQRIASQLQPVMRQARWAVEQIERGNVKLDDTPALNQFILGALGAVPQVEGIAVTDPRALNRRWNGSSVEPLVEDWSGSPDIAAWLEAGASLTGPRWQAPFWTSTIESTILLLDTPIRVNGKFMGLFSQAVTISDLSRHIASVGTETGVIPFILHGRDHVLAHPLLISWAPSVTDQDQPLVTVEALGDPVLERIWTPDHRELYLLGGLTEASASGVAVGDDYYVFLYRDIDLYGPEPWTIGAYVNTGTSDVGEWLAEIVRSALSGSFTRSGTMEGNEFERVIASVVAGFAVLVLSVALAAWLGARASRPVRALATAARSIEARGLDAVAPLQRSRVAEFDDANRSFNRMVAGLKESELVRETLGRFVPTDVAKTLLTEGGELAPRQAQATVLFCDLEGFTGLTENLGPDGIVELLNEYFEVMVEVLERHRGVVTQFQGDAILATFNVPVPDPDHAANALRAAIEMQEATRRRAFAGQRIGNRIGVNTGPLVAGAVGAKGRLSYTVHGDAVNLAARLEALNKELGTRILVSAATAEQVEGFALDPMGEVGVRGQTERVRIHVLRSGAG